MVAQRKWPYITPEEYLKCERESDTKHEYIDGVIVAMAGASPEHINITMNLTVALDPYLDSAGCNAYASDMRVRVGYANSYYYPDYVTVCNKPDFDSIQGLSTLLNPSVIIEVLSKSTERTDLVEKWLAYRQLKSLTMYLLVHQDKPLIEGYIRNAPNGQWEPIKVEGLDAKLNVLSLDCVIPLARIYKRIAFRQSEEGESRG